MNNANLSANRQKQGLAIDVGPGLRRSREMANIGELENMPSVLFNLWRNNGQEETR
jgi:hypothetical protein